VLNSVEIGGGSDGTTFTGAIGVWSGNTGSQLLKVNVHHTSDGLRIDGNTLIQDSYVHDLNFCCGYHSDGSQTTQGSNITFRHNTIQGGSNDPIWLKSDSGPISNVTIDNNKLQGTGTPSNESSYDLGVEGSVSGVSVTNNLFTGVYQVAPAESFGYSTWSGNTLNGQPLAKP